MSYPRVRSLLGLAALTALGCALAWASAPPLERVLHHGPIDFQTALAGGAGALAWLALTWFAGCTLLAVLARLPGLAGRCAGRVAASITPAAIRRMVEAALGASIVMGTTGQLAYAAIPGPQHVPAGAHGLPRPDRPAPHGAPAPGTDRPGDDGDRHGHGGDRTVVVRRGDTLWDIAASHLTGPSTDRRIAAEWPRWYAANRSVIGSDPNLILPGQRLQPPEPA